jgi:DNA invertase Pin-like site-specific DNA recombinase
MLERQRMGIARAKGEGKYRGRAPAVAKRAADIRSMYAAGLKPTHIAKQLKVARSSVYRILRLSRRATDWMPAIIRS